MVSLADVSIFHKKLLFFVWSFKIPNFPPINLCRNLLVVSTKSWGPKIHRQNLGCFISWFLLGVQHWHAVSWVVIWSHHQRLEWNCIGTTRRHKKAGEIVSFEGWKSVCQVAGWFCPGVLGRAVFFFQFFYTQWVDIYIYIYWTLWLKIVWSPPERNGWLKDITSFFKTRGWLDITSEASTVPTWHKRFNPNSFPKMAISISACFVTKSFFFPPPLSLTSKTAIQDGAL